MGNNDLPTNDETSKADEGLNVTPDLPDTGNPTSPDNGSTEPSDADGSNDDTPADNGGDDSTDANVQAQVQKHAELRKKAEDEAKAKADEAAEATKRAEEASAKANRLQKEKIEAAIKDAVTKSGLPEGYVQNRVGKDPVNWFLAHQSGLPPKMTWDEVETLVSDKLGDLVSGLAKDLHITPADQNTPNFTDNNNAPADSQVPNAGSLTVDQIKNMSPYELNNLPDEIKSQLAQLGNKVEL